VKTATTVILIRFTERKEGQQMFVETSKQGEQSKQFKIQILYNPKDKKKKLKNILENVKLDKLNKRYWKR
jgi:hypothetical protein